MNLLGNINTRSITDFKDPFKSDKVDDISMRIRKALFDDEKIQFVAMVNFKNGNTSGSHRIEGKSFPDLVHKVSQFINSL